MDAEQFDSIEKLADNVYDKFDELYKKGIFAEIEAKMKDVCASLKEEY